MTLLERMPRTVGAITLAAGAALVAAAALAALTLVDGPAAVALRQAGA